MLTLYEIIFLNDQVVNASLNLPIYWCVGTSFKIAFKKLFCSILGLRKDSPATTNIQLDISMRRVSKVIFLALEKDFKGRSEK